MDFVHDILAGGRLFWILTDADSWSRPKSGARGLFSDVGGDRRPGP